MSCLSVTAGSHVAKGGHTAVSLHTPKREEVTNDLLH